MSAQYVIRHKQVMTKIKEQAQANPDEHVRVANFAKLLPEMDPRTVLTHLRLMEIDGCISFLDEEKDIFWISPSLDLEAKDERHV